MIKKFSPYVSPIRIVFAEEVSSRNSNGLPEWGVKQRRLGKTSHFLAFNVNIYKTIGDTAKVTINMEVAYSLSIDMTKIDDLG